MWKAFFRAVRTGEHRVSGLSWFALIATVVYTISPVDLIPELVFPIIGYVDDLGLWGVMLLVAGREKQAWEAQLKHTSVSV